MNKIHSLFYKILAEKKLLKDSMLVIIANSFVAMTTFITNLLWGKMLGPESYGNLKTILYLSGFFSSFLSFGLVVTLTKYIAEFRAKNKKKIGPLTRWIIKIRFITYLIFFSFFLIFINRITLFFLDDVSLKYMMLSTLFIVFANFFGIFPFMVQGYENFKLFSLSRFVFAIFYFLLGFGLIFFGAWYAVLGVAFANLISNFVCLKFLVRMKAFEKINQKLDFKKIFLRFSLPIYIFNIPAYLGNAVVPILRIFFPGELIGYYSFSFIFYYAALVIPTALTSIVLPKVSRLNGLKKHEDAKRVLSKIFAIYIPIMIFGIIGTLLFSKFFLSFIAPEYLPGLIFFKVLLCLGFLTGNLVIYTSYLIGKGKMKQVAIIILLQNIVLLLVSFLMLKIIS